MLDAIELSWVILRRCASNNTPISHLQLQKMLYFLQRLNLKQKDEPLFKNKIYAWQFGPVVRDVYYELSIFSSLRIVPSKINPDPNIELADFILEEVDKRAKEKPWDMVDETHKPGGPWDVVYQNGLGNGLEIPLSEIKRDAERS